MPKPGEFFVVSNNQAAAYNKRLLNTASFSALPDQAMTKSQSQVLKPFDAKSLSSKYIENVMQNKSGRF